jgi:hypothetical protein
MGGMAMKASSILFMGLAVALISIPPANAERSKKAEPSPSNWAEAKARWDGLTTYQDCMAMVTEAGWTRTEGFAGCTGRHFKK